MQNSSPIISYLLTLAIWFSVLEADKLVVSHDFI